ncbi:DnaJ-domain-containing protein [Cylindrobasidium torrendii FP15055 ss-10]|uniref:DnaJ-domain-containing protein n=1 Tax=Cylindrobasidium torrendii FP15055 ss-10 TaxID=1314674 RepID=A0A0D7BI04_9AGAR|nr:DnaJ-domain-containing protein [Cylindrobasidium torrendii FP15055 ss-10]
MSDEDVNPYELIGVGMDADDQAIKSAYRKTSLKVHPDRNPNNPEAARLFHELNQAYELLLDPLRRLAVDTKLKAKQVRKERYKTYDNKRKVLVEELEERERAFKRQRANKQRDDLKRYQDTERVKEEGRRLREEKEKELREREHERVATPPPRPEDEPPSIGATDTTVRVKFTLAAHPELATKEALSSLLAPFGPTDTDAIVLSLKPPKKNPAGPAKNGTALISFKRIGDAFAAVCASGQAARGLKDVDIAWVGSKEPEIIGWLKSTGKLSAAQPPPTPPNAHTSTRATESAAFSSFPLSFPTSFPQSIPEPTPSAAAATVDYESLTLMRLRQAERERLEREIRDQESEE